MSELSVKCKMPNTSSEGTLYYIEPNECPSCKYAIKPHLLFCFVNPGALSAYIMFECRKCNDAFIKSIRNLFKSNSANIFYEREGAISILSPNPPTPTIFSDYIMIASPQFSDIFNQASAAENYGLSEIAGMGYRKAAEFLIKDYLANELEDAPEMQKIKDKLLGNCIKDHISNPQLKAIAERIAWLGNDETHYIRKHTDKDVNDLKRLIDVAVRWIEMELMAKEAIETIEYKK